MRLTPLDIYQQEFRRVLRGLDPDEVEDFLERIADDYEELIRENADLKERVESLEAQLTTDERTGRPDSSESATGEEVNNIIREAKKEADNLIREARKEADNIIHKARDEVDRIRSEAEKISDETVRIEADMGADKLLENAKMEELELRREISKLRAQKERFLIEYRELLEKHLRFLTTGLEE